MLIILIASIICGVLYRLGGIGKPFKTWMRDWTIPFVFLVALSLLKGFHLFYWWEYALTWGLMGGALTTYYDTIFGYDNYYAHGFGIGLAASPLIWAGMPWQAILLRSVALAMAMGIWSNLINWDDLEEMGRGAFICATIPMLLI